VRQKKARPGTHSFTSPGVHSETDIQKDNQAATILCWGVSIDGGSSVTTFWKKILFGNFGLPRPPFYQVKLSKLPTLTPKMGASYAIW
jgi:hypothetical protein